MSIKIKLTNNICKKQITKLIVKHIQKKTLNCFIKHAKYKYFYIFTKIKKIYFKDKVLISESER